ncbi:P-loop containing nucleoside triphosphate hydrolase protein [Suillus placidus]|uniref:P-loop containing nucleoside triphosphate hydrolase protein n=1 Tax=Suillus placidus TaxID=48579 RepID=A0A9P6ZP65_9AGAM|nr:P-loop containing nucleoside triphosphate hydrolase protein [Suillus placidus]
MSRRMLFRAKCRHTFNQECMEQYMSTAGDMTPDRPVCHIALTIGIEAPALELEANFNISSARQGIFGQLDIETWRSSSKIEALVEELSNLRLQDQNLWQAFGQPLVVQRLFWSPHIHRQSLQPVTYSAEGFLDRNLNALNPDFVSLLHGLASGISDGAEGAGSMNPFVKGLFSGKAIVTQAHPKNEDTIVAAQQPAKPMRAPSTRCKGTIKCMPTLRENGIDEQDGDAAGSGTPCVAGEFRSALDTLFETLGDMQNWYIFCINPNDWQLPNQLEGRSVKGQVRSLGMTEIAKRNVNMFEVGMTPEEFCQRYRDSISALGISEGTPRERVEQTWTALPLKEWDVVLGQYKASGFKTQLRLFVHRMLRKQKRNRVRDAEAEAGLDVRGFGDPYAPYPSPGANNGEESPFINAFLNPALPLVSDAFPFQRADLYDDEYDERKSLRSDNDNFDNRSHLTSNRDAPELGYQ